MELTERLIGRSPPEDWMIVYDLSADASRLRAMQETSLAARTDAGLDPNPLVGSSEWTAEIHNGRPPIHTVTGMIGRVYWGSMADYAEFTIVTSDQEESNWAREGDSRLYVPGIAVELFYVEHAWKKDLRHRLSDHCKIKLAIWLERSPHRSSAIAPGPGGAGYELARREGEVVHYLVFPDSRRAQQAATDLEAIGARARAATGPATGRCYVRCWSANDDVGHDVGRLSEFAASRGGEYDGGERVEGPVWGPHETPPSSS
jgi:hypothetical protein